MSPFSRAVFQLQYTQAPTCSKCGKTMNQESITSNFRVVWACHNRRCSFPHVTTSMDDRDFTRYAVIAVRPKLPE